MARMARFPSSARRAPAPPPTPPPPAGTDTMSVSSRTQRMTRFLLPALLAACAGQAAAQTAAPAVLPTLPPAPILEGYTADPSIRVFGDTYYLYPTSDKDKWQTTDFSVWSSKNLVDWKKERMILDVTKDLKWGKVEAWAPDAIARNGRYYFYFSAERKIGVATAASPTGPFVDALGAPLVTRTGKVNTNTIDPYPFIDDDGQAYLYFGNSNRIANVFKLKPDMVTLDGDPVEMRIHQFREGIVVFKRKGVYYFMWSIDDARSPNYRVGWGTATSPLGPVVAADKDFIVLQKNGPAVGTAHHSVVNVPGTDRWYVAYHRHAIPNGNGYTRETVLARMEFNADGSIKPMDPMTAPFKPGDVGEPIVGGKGLPDR
ncbi:family 43 glycosylhydrolase [Massilia sp. CFBP 13647]|nr:family 43 glycosylhydrolase [Massilia sp. CFBP 13647]MBD8674734.1 family 43 glycosylhydrolase [Massilia sp. CFBP 13721]